MKPLSHICIIAFCVWHMFAVAVFTIPRVSTDAFSANVREVLLPVVTPYMYTTSQWQLWDLFAPNPLRRITLYRIEKLTDNTWTTIETIKPGSYPWWKHATYFKFIINTMGKTEDPTHAMQSLFLKDRCRLLELPPDSLIRLVMYTSVIPVPPRAGSMKFWNEWRLEWRQDIQTEYYCPAAS